MSSRANALATPPNGLPSANIIGPLPLCRGWHIPKTSLSFELLEISPIKSNYFEYKIDNYEILTTFIK